MSLFRHFDWWIFFSAVAISVLSLLIQSSVAPDLFRSQLEFIAIGLVLFFFFSQIDPHIYTPLKYMLYFFSIVGLLITFGIGQEIRGSARWINIGPLVIQPSEIIKPFVILFLAAHFSPEGKHWPKLYRALAFILPVILLIFKQPDLGNAIIYGFIFIGIILAEGYLPVIIGGIGLFAVSTPLIWNILHDYQRKRIITFINPGIDPQGAGYNALQSTIAVGSGGILGKGLGQGTQSHLQFLPEHHTDFIFAAYAEELGFVGVVILIILYALLLMRLIKIAKESTSKEASLICLGVFSMLIAHIFINIGMNSGIMPITGITLPLMSYGGSSIITVFISLGIIESLMRTKKTENTLTIK